MHLLGEQQAMHEDQGSLGGACAARGLRACAVARQRRGASAELGVGDALVVEHERRHNLSLSPICFRSRAAHGRLLTALLARARTKPWIVRARPPLRRSPEWAIG